MPGSAAGLVFDSAEPRTDRVSQDRGREGLDEAGRVFLLEILPKRIAFGEAVELRGLGD